MLFRSEKHLFSNRIFKRIDISLKKNSTDIRDLEILLKKQKIRIQSVDLTRNTRDSADRVVFYVYILEKSDIALLSEILEKTDGVLGFSIEMVS